MTPGVDAKFKPLLASPADLENMQFPVFASPKIDGIRCGIDPKIGAMSRTLKPIPNLYIRECLNVNDNALAYLDGEIITYDEEGVMEPLDMVQSKVMTRAGKPNFIFHVFDSFENPDRPYDERLARLADDHRIKDSLHTKLVPTILVNSLEQLMHLEQLYVDQLGWEGIMTRKPTGRYKYGRSTLKEAILLKIKRFFDSEATIKGYKELMHNANEATESELGYTKRSSHQENMIPMGTLGALECVWFNGAEFSIGTGFDAATRARLWAIRDTLKGGNVTFKFQREGPNKAPLLPVYKAIRHADT